MSAVCGRGLPKLTVTNNCTGIRMKAPSIVRELIQRFTAFEDSYRSAQYNETQLRREFIDPLFEALGWDIHNKQGLDERFKDVVHEDSIRIEGRAKAPDYSFRVGGTRVFFVEAKRPSLDIKKDPAPAFQLRRYAFSANLTVSILTDFEEFSVYDCRIRPTHKDAASMGRILYIRYEDFEAKWGELSALFSPESIKRGSLERFGSGRRVRGTAEVDDAFLNELETWRADLARNIALRNRRISEAELNEAVQTTIDRIVFLRICEDRGIERYGSLSALVKGEGIYPRLLEAFERADEVYDSGLFHFHVESGRTGRPDVLTPALSIDDSVLRKILANLYYPESPYEFSVMPAEILGNVYERFLGNTIRLTPSHRAKVEAKPEVAKAGGVFYTPAYVVRYIVDNTLSELIRKKRPADVAKIKVLDPACGSGSFLLGAYQALQDWHLNTYTRTNPQSHAKGRNPRLYCGPRGDWRLTASEKKRILTNSIFGVDIDPQAVEVTKLSLLLKVLEGESEETVGKTLDLFKERALPDLDMNIRCGNSLIGPDYLSLQVGLPVEACVELDVTCFDWRAEFPSVFERSRPGFDVVIGNPPYLNLKRGFLSVQQKAYFQSVYETAHGQYDAFALFIEKAIHLLRPGGRHAYIVPKPVLVSESYESVRSLLLKSTIESISETKAPFDNADVETTVVSIKKRKPSGNHLVELSCLSEQGETTPLGEALQSVFAGLPFRGLSYLVTSSRNKVIDRMQRFGRPLGEIASLFTRGIEAGKRSPRITAKKRRGTKPLLRGEDVGRYCINYAGLQYDVAEAEEREWKNTDIYDQPSKVLIRRVANSVVAAVDREGFWVLNTLYSLVVESWLDEDMVAGILNSRLLSFYLRVVFLSDDKLFPYLRISQLAQLPIVVPDAHARSLSGPLRRIAHLASQRGNLARELTTAKATREFERIEREARAADMEINGAVFQAYGLSRSEVQIVNDLG